DEKFDKAVAAARAKAIDYLKAKQTRDGNWEGGDVLPLSGMDGGATGLVTLALLEAGVPAGDPVLAKPLAYLAALEPEKTYVVSLQTQVLCRAGPKKYKEAIQKSADWL